MSMTIYKLIQLIPLIMWLNFHLTQRKLIFRLQETQRKEKLNVITSKRDLASTNFSFPPLTSAVFYFSYCKLYEQIVSVRYIRCRLLQSSCSVWVLSSVVWCSLSFFLCFSGNDSKVDGLVNFEKLRMIAKEIRHVGRMASVNMDPALMFRTR